MKNLHLIPTDKPSRLHLAYEKDYYLSVEPFIQFDTKNYKSFNIYITSDEEIKEGDWCIYKTGEIIQYLVKLNTDNLKKIILTTDQDLIKDEVQKIDDTFLEWFVKNPSCEEVVTERVVVYDDNNNGSGEIFHSNKKFVYEIIIPQEESKQREVFLMNANEVIDTQKPKQETVEGDGQIPDDYYPPKDLANAIWGSCFDYKDLDKNIGIREKLVEACFRVEKLYEMQQTIQDNKKS
jgi:hypothetical protein